MARRSATPVSEPTTNDFEFAVAQLRELADSEDEHVRVRAAEALARLVKPQSTLAPIPPAKEQPASIPPDQWIPWAADEMLAEINAGRVSPEAVRKYLTPVLCVLPNSAWEESSGRASASVNVGASLRSRTTRPHPA